MIKSILLSISAFGALASCGTSLASTQARIVSLSNAADTTFDTYVDGQNILVASALPASDSADYSGAIFAQGGIGDPGNDTEEVRVAYVGEIDLNVNFNDGTLTGTGHDFANVENLDEIYDDTDPIVNGDVAGTLVFTGEQSDSIEAAFELLVTGDLSGPEGSFLSFDETGGAADVYGPNAEALRIAGGTLVDNFDNQAGYIGFAAIASQ